jgi:hypothetical protein
MTRSTTPQVSCGPSRILLTWLLTFDTAHRRLTASTTPSTSSIGQLMLTRAVLKRGSGS